MELRSLLYGSTEQSAAFWATLRRWWDGLDRNRGARARLRRAKTPDEVFVSPDYQRGLLALLASSGIALDAYDAQRLAIGIGVLVHVKTALPEGHFARQLTPADESQESVRDPRFRKLLATTAPDDLFLMLRRLADYLGGTAEIRSLVTGASDWTDKTRRAWAVEYYVNRKAKK
ncbi:MAG: type I-E CRISPR-associated protein Cse2/CasB [Desulfovibrio sp.]